ncbi:DUF4974 domain-containing protein [Mariniphaga sediminis]|jgi:ferric-dicitrate binding protein FerR (iron transport regulator)|uniref:DUF4974 domain-containing protein n=1 Tax=Mariniphaga sediminis TaxID=1628158 RepID=A0A399D0N5_9BACT|nr:FecR domain-containing protein [Mariniphaga sediminis]RIH65026.1 DUF4974 domain-containing protein [Mariniphaga sediminis]
MQKSNNIKEIVEKYVRGESNRKELEKAMELFADPNRNLGIRPVLFRYWEKEEESKIKELPPLSNPEMILDKIHHRIHLGATNNPRSSSGKWTVNFLKVAAILILGLVIGLLIHNLQKSEPIYYTAIAPKGSISQMILPDSTIVFLNAGSELKYTETQGTFLLSGIQKQRTVFLSGEAWFDVTRNEKKPFVVHTPLYDVKVLGTQFNVKAYPKDNEVTTTLEKGSVQITSFANGTTDKPQTLQPGEQLAYRPNEGITVQTVIPKMFTAWKDNKLIFINMNLKELFVLLERKYGVDIEVADNVVLNYHYDSTITDESILEVLDLIAETLPIRYKIEGQTVIIQKR